MDTATANAASRRIRFDQIAAIEGIQRDIRTVRDALSRSLYPILSESEEKQIRILDVVETQAYSPFRSLDVIVGESEILCLCGR